MRSSWSHDDAVEELRRNGIPAIRRNWALGDTVGLPLGADLTHTGPIDAYPSAAWLVPQPDGTWQLVQTVNGHQRVQAFDTLEAAVLAGIELNRLFHPTEACSDCAGTANVSFGEWVGRGTFTYYISTSCPQCGARSEADGGDSLPDDLRSLELRRNGRWALRVEVIPSPKAWSTLRHELGLDLAGLAALKRRVPGDVFAGTFAEAERIRLRLAAGEIQCQVSEVAD